LSGKFSGFRSEGRTASLEEEHRDDASVLRIRVRSEPSKACAVLRAGAGFAEHIFLEEAGAEAACGAVLRGSEHADADLRDQWRDIEIALHLRLEVGDVFCAGRMLQVVKRSAVCHRRNQRAELQRSHADALAERAHLANAAELRG